MGTQQVTDYLLDGDKILQEYTYADPGYTLLPSSAADCITYYYDEAGDVIGLNYYGSNYYYYKNIFGDVLGIMTPSGTMVVRYSYDAWGNILSITGTLANSLGKNNPFRYRSYYYDSETGWYYLQSRYYDPAICRFISPDSLLQIGEGAVGINLYAYCGNNPVNRLDPDGTFWKEAGEAILKGIEKFGDAVAGAFQFEFGFGAGFGSTKSIGPLEVQVSAYQDGLTFGYKNGKEFTAIKGSAGIQMGGNMGISTQYEHRFETDYKADYDEHITTSMPWNVYFCPKTVKDPCILGFPVGSKVQGELSPGLFLGYSSESHFILGYHFSVGFDVTEFFRILGE